MFYSTLEEFNYQYIRNLAKLRIWRRLGCAFSVDCPESDPSLSLGSFMGTPPNLIMFVCMGFADNIPYAVYGRNHQTCQRAA